MQEKIIEKWKYFRVTIRLIVRTIIKERCPRNKVTIMTRTCSLERLHVVRPRPEHDSYTCVAWQAGHVSWVPGTTRVWSGVRGVSYVNVPDKPVQWMMFSHGRRWIGSCWSAARGGDTCRGNYFRSLSPQHTVSRSQRILADCQVRKLKLELRVEDRWIRRTSCSCRSCWTKQCSAAVVVHSETF